jgi:hypothetical protein
MKHITFAIASLIVIYAAVWFVALYVAPRIAS